MGFVWIIMDGERWLSFNKSCQSLFEHAAEHIKSLENSIVAVRSKCTLASEMSPKIPANGASTGLSSCTK